jgi:hypothetical protein
MEISANIPQNDLRPKCKISMSGSLAQRKPAVIEKLLVEGIHCGD